MRGLYSGYNFASIDWSAADGGCVMAAKIIDGSAVAREYRAELRKRVQALNASGVQPGLAVVIVGDDPASQLYVRNKTRACAETGVRTEEHRFAAAVDPAEVLRKIAALNEDRSVHGILVQLPLPPQFDPALVLDAVARDKDADGFHPYNLGSLLAGRPVFNPCTPYGIMRLLDYFHIEIAGSDAVVVGRSNIVGKPMALMLLNRHASVSILTSRTRDLARYTSQADILVAAVGKPGLITANMVKPGATVIDVGINRIAPGRFAGDVDFAGVSERAGYITPVPGGVGPMTVAALIGNTVTAAERFSAAAS